MEKIITIGEKDINFKATAGTLRRYRAMFHRDLMCDMINLATALEKNKNEQTQFSKFELETFENVAYIMAKQGNNEIPDNIDDWLDTFEIFNIYEILPDLLELWTLETDTQITSKKNLMTVVGK